MTSLAQVTALVDAHVTRDPQRFRAVTLQIAAHLAGRSSHAAEHLRKLIDRQQAVALTPLPSANGLLSVVNELPTFDDMVLAPSIRERLDRVLLEHARRDELLASGLRPARKLLFSGQAGTGKTMAAGALAHALGLPLFRVELHAVIASHLGETAANLAKVFMNVRSMPAVYLFDEVDALGAERASNDSSAAGAEMRRVVNSLLQFIEDDRSDGLIVAATNHAQLLDAAIFRRFDEAIRFEPLSLTELTELTVRALRDFDADGLDFGTIYTASPNLGHADLCAVLDRVRKDHVLTKTVINTKRLVDGISRRMASS